MVGQGAVLAIAFEMWKGNDAPGLVVEGYQGQVNDGVTGG